MICRTPAGASLRLLRAATSGLDWEQDPVVADRDDGCQHRRHLVHPDQDRDPQEQLEDDGNA